MANSARNDADPDPLHNFDTGAESYRGYKIGYKIGEGSYAYVTTARFKKEGCKTMKLACKIIDKEKAPIEFVNKFFPRELDIISKLNHPNIIQIHSILQRGLKIYIFMRYAEKGDLLTYLKKVKYIQESQCRPWFIQMTEALEYLHSNHIAHRDLKCENILLSSRYNIKLADFGFACYCSSGHGQKNWQSQTYCGSAAYAAPEIVKGVPYDAQISDCWSLGVVLFIMLNGKMPFNDTSLTRLFNDQRNGKYKFRENLAISSKAKCAVAYLLDPSPITRWTALEILNCTWVKKAKN